MCRKISTECCILGISVEVFLAAVIVFAIIIGANANIEAVDDVSPTFPNNDTITSYRYRYLIGVKLVSGRIETDTIRRFNGSDHDIIFDLNNIRSECEFDYYRTVCDAKLENTLHPECLTDGLCEKDTSCTNLCEAQKFKLSGICLFDGNADVCTTTTMKPTTCYDIYIINEDKCKTKGSLQITEDGITSIFDISRVDNIQTKNGLDVNIESIDNDVPFFGELITLREEDGILSYNIFPEYNLCTFSDVVGCRGPIHKDFVGEKINYHSLASANTRMSHFTSKKESGKWEAVIGDRNRKIKSYITTANDLKSSLGNYNINTTSRRISFPHHTDGTMKFIVYLSGPLIKETIPPCAIEFVGIECEGLENQELMDCEISIVVGHTIGSAITITWNDQTFNYECTTTTDHLANVLKTEDPEQFAYTVSSPGTVDFTNKAEVQIEHQPAGQGDSNGDDVQGSNNEPGPSPAEINKETKRIRDLTILWSVIITVAASVLFILVGLCLFSPMIMKCYDDEKMSKRFRSARLKTDEEEQSF